MEFYRCTKCGKKETHISAWRDKFPKATICPCGNPFEIEPIIETWNGCDGKND